MDPCLNCGDWFESSANNHQLYCTKRCKQAYYRKRDKPDLGNRQCGFCRGSMTGKRPQAKWCADYCRDKARRVRERQQD